MARKKPRFIADQCLDFVANLSHTSKKANIIRLADIGVPPYATDADVLAAGQKEKRVVITADERSGFSYRTVLNPTYNHTGAVLIKADYNKEILDEIISKFIDKISHDDLVGARTKVTSKKATITSSTGQYKIEFD